MRFATAALIPLLAACSSSLEPGRPATLLVENTTCDAVCSPIEILLFPKDQPRTPGGSWSIPVGTVTTRLACLTIPAADSFRIFMNDSLEKTFRWTRADAAELGAIAEGGFRLMAGPQTADFVPARSPGWRVALPDGGALQAISGCPQSGQP